MSFFKENSTLEIGMIVVLSTICFAIVVFVVSCFVYASKHKIIQAENKERINGRFPILREPRRQCEPTTNAHNWVWLGRSTMDRSSMILENANDNLLHNRGLYIFFFFIYKIGRNNFSMPHIDSRIRITRNPIPANFIESENAIVDASIYMNAQRRVCQETPYYGPSYR